MEDSRRTNNDCNSSSESTPMAGTTARGSRRQYAYAGVASVVAVRPWPAIAGARGRLPPLGSLTTTATPDGPQPLLEGAMHGFGRVSFTDRTGQIAGVRYRYTGPVWPETGRYQSNSNLNSKNSVQPVRTGIPAGLTGLLTGLNSNQNLKSHV